MRSLSGSGFHQALKLFLHFLQLRNTRESETRGNQFRKKPTGLTMFQIISVMNSSVYPY